LFFNEFNSHGCSRCVSNRGFHDHLQMTGTSLIQQAWEMYAFAWAVGPTRACWIAWFKSFMKDAPFWYCIDCISLGMLLNKKLRCCHFMILFSYELWFPPHAPLDSFRPKYCYAVCAVPLCILFVALNSGWNPCESMVSFLELIKFCILYWKTEEYWQLNESQK
jgi:hypothetical protein